MIYILLGIFIQDSIFQRWLGADPQKYIMHQMGLWTLRFLMITLAITPLRKWFNFTSLILFRRMFGLFSMFYATLHLLTYYVLYLDGNIANVVEDIIKRPYITVGFTAYLLLVPMAFTSTKKMMRRLGKNWQKLHRSIYIVVLLGVIHFIWQVKSDLNEPVMYLLIIMLLLIVRVKWGKLFSFNTVKSE